MASSEPKKTPNFWLWGCAIGCGTILLAGVAFTLGGYLFVTRGMTEAKQEALNSFTANFELCQKAGRLDTEQEVVFRDLLQMSAQKETSFMAVVIADYLLKQTVAAKESDTRQTSYAMAVELRDLLRENPQAGLSEMARFVSEHPALKEHFYPEEKSASARMEDPPLPWQKDQNREKE